jgi:EAL domain-containing protein (putative c-di-GMP-specific phosphodiesterase class I)
MQPMGDDPFLALTDGFFNEGPAAFAVTDADGRLVYTNRRWRGLQLGRAGDSLSRFVVPTEGHHLEEMLACRPGDLRHALFRAAPNLQEIRITVTRDAGGWGYYWIASLQSEDVPVEHTPAPFPNPHPSLGIAEHLTEAIDSERLQVAFQPIYELRSMTLHGFEALARWTDPDLGVVSPDLFISAAEATGMVVPLDALILKKALVGLRKMVRHAPDITMSVNFSAAHLQSPDVVSRVQRLLREMDVPAHQLQLELTETAVVEHPREALRTMRDLRALGVRLAIDDFGTGYASLQSLWALPFDTLKVDRRFVGACGTTRQPLLRAIVRLAQSLDLEVVAEGVETNQQLDTLLDLDADFGQGYHFSQPVNLEKAARLAVESNENTGGARFSTVPAE